MSTKLDAKAFGLTLGILWAVGVFFMSLIAMISTGYLHNIVDFFTTVYLGYDLSFLGVIAGVLWGFFDGAIGGFVIAWLYNKLSQ